MTTDVVALTEKAPDSWSLVAALMAAGPEAGTTPRGNGAVIQLNDGEGRPLAFVESTVEVQVPGEVSRLLGVPVSGPVWWTEARAATAAQGAEKLAGTIATRLVRLLGGQVWPPEMAAADGGAEPVAEVSGGRSVVAEQPAVDVLTEKAAVVIQDRPVVALSAWLADAFRASEGTEGRALQIVTPDTARLTLPTRAALSGLPNRWVVRDREGGYYDGLSGAVLRWQDGAFTPTGTGEPAPSFVQATARAHGAGERQLVLSFRTLRPATRGVLLGGGLEAVCRRLTGAAPAGWGTAEPAGRAWSSRELTDFARLRAPEPSLFVVVGGSDRRAIGTLRSSTTTGGVEEDVTFAVGYPAGAEPEWGALPELAEELVTHHGLVSLLVQLRQARADLAVPPWLEAAPTPLAFALGHDEAERIGRAQVERPPLASAPFRLGRLGRQGLYYQLEEGGWGAFQQLMTHLRATDGGQQG